MTHDIKYRVLVVEDEEIVRIIINDYLSMSGFDVYEYDQSPLALKHLEKECVDIAIVDINMPEISGEKFILSAIKICPKLQFIIHTGDSDYQVTDSLREIGLSTNNVLTKPVEDMNIFKTTINLLMSQRS